MTEEQLQALRAAISVCRRCRDEPARGEGHRLPHEPRPVAVLSASARILIAGQAPGLRVHESGLPFNDASGDRLRQWLSVDRAAFY
ncbi:uracil-DNA glycosylase family protein, partial [Sinorhizobium meliloti]